MLHSVMSSCRCREEDRALTLPQLEAFGVTPELFLSECEPAGPPENLANGLRAIASSKGRDVLFLEDDIDLAPDFGTFLDMVRELGVMTWLYINDRPHRSPALYGRAVWRMIEAREAFPRGLLKPNTYYGLWGAQCVFIPSEHVKGLLRFKEPFNGAFDDLLQTYAARVQADVRVAIPNPVQHRQSRVGRTADNPQNVKRSASFALPRV